MATIEIAEVTKITEASGSNKTMTTITPFSFSLRGMDDDDDDDDDDNYDVEMLSINMDTMMNLPRFTDKARLNSIDDTTTITTTAPSVVNPKDFRSSVALKPPAPTTTRMPLMITALSSRTITNENFVGVTKNKRKSTRSAPRFPGIDDDDDDDDNNEANAGKPFQTGDKKRKNVSALQPRGGSLKISAPIFSTPKHLRSECAVVDNVCIRPVSESRINNPSSLRSSSQDLPYLPISLEDDHEYQPSNPPFKLSQRSRPPIDHHHGNSDFVLPLSPPARFILSSQNEK